MTITSSLPSIESTNLIADPSTEPVEDKHTMDEQPDKISQVATKRLRTKRQQYNQAIYKNSTNNKAVRQALGSQRRAFNINAIVDSTGFYA